MLQKFLDWSEGMSLEIDSKQMDEINLVWGLESTQQPYLKYIQALEEMNIELGKQ